MFELSIGAVASAVIPRSEGSPRCVLTWCATLPKPVGDLACAESFGVALKLLCCAADLIRGCSSCHPVNQCPDTATMPDGSKGLRDELAARSSIRREIDKALTTEDSCDETLAGNGANYRGCQTKTNGGLECQKWSSQYPHKYNPAVNWWKNGQHGLGDHGQCRNPSGQSTIWCHTKSPNKRWDYCSEFDAGNTYVSKNVMTTWQTSVGWGGVSSRAVDGNTNSDWSAGGCTHTYNDWKPWWQGNLQTEQGIEKVKVYNRGQGHGWRLSGYRVDVVKLSPQVVQNCGKNIEIADGASKMSTCGKIGTYVEIMIERTEYLMLCEVKVTLMYTFMGLSRSRAQESGGSNADAAKAVDGNAATNYPSGGCTHTNYQWSNWWQVDMQGLADIVKVKVTNRGDCCGSRLNGFKLEIDGANCAENQQIGQGEAVESECNMPGHIVKITVPRNDWLTLCEVQVATKTPTLRPPMVAQVFVVGTWVSMRGGMRGYYCSDEINALKCNRGALQRNEKFYVGKGWGGTTKISLKGGWGNRWCSDRGTWIECNKNASPGPWESFEPARGETSAFGGGGVAIKGGGPNNGYCTDVTNAVQCNRNSSPGPWQTFEVKCTSGCADTTPMPTRAPPPPPPPPPPANDDDYWWYWEEWHGGW